VLGQTTLLFVFTHDVEMVLKTFSKQTSLLMPIFHNQQYLSVFIGLIIGY